MKNLLASLILGVFAGTISLQAAPVQSQTFCLTQAQTVLTLPGGGNGNPNNGGLTAQEVTAVLHKAADYFGVNRGTIRSDYQHGDVTITPLGGTLYQVDAPIYGTKNGGGNTIIDINGSF